MAFSSSQICRCLDPGFCGFVPIYCDCSGVSLTTLIGTRNTTMPYNSSSSQMIPSYIRSNSNQKPGVPPGLNSPAASSSRICQYHDAGYCGFIPPYCDCPGRTFNGDVPISNATNVTNLRPFQTEARPSTTFNLNEHGDTANWFFGQRKENYVEDRNLDQGLSKGRMKLRTTNMANSQDVNWNPAFQPMNENVYFQYPSSSHQSFNLQQIKPAKNSSSIVECRFCKANKEPKDIYQSHILNMWDSQHKKFIVVCPILRRYKCSECGESGDTAHTITYCPKLIKKLGYRPKSIIAKLNETLRNSAGKLRK